VEGGVEGRARIRRICSVAGELEHDRGDQRGAGLPGEWNVKMARWCEKMKLKESLKEVVDTEKLCKRSVPKVEQDVCQMVAIGCDEGSLDGRCVRFSGRGR
jgi:hypothetical protein